MARKPRFHVPGGFYHVIARGNHQQTIFHDEGYYMHYLALLERNAVNHSMTVHAYALMTNHVHLLVQVGEQPLGDFMKGVQQGYTQYVNTRNQQSGHLFQGRYNAILIDSDEYLLALVRYIHLNPVTAGIVKDPIDYRWSSHRHYFSGGGEGKVEVGLIKEMMENSGTEIGDYQLLSRKRKQHRGKCSLITLMNRVSAVTDLPTEEIQGTNREREVSEVRWLFAYLAANDGYTLTEIAQYLGRARSAVSMAIGQIKDNLRQGGKWQLMLRRYHDHAVAQTTEQMGSDPFASVDGL